MLIERVSRWLRRGAAPEGAAAQRWVVIDVETSGLDTGSDVVLAIGAVAVHGTSIVVADSFELVVRPETASARPNILVHGIGEAAQRAGLEPAQACEQFLSYVGDAPLVAFHADFDRAFLTRTVREHCRQKLANPWLDVAELAPSLFPQVREKALDGWLEHFAIDVTDRHHASSDAFATAMLFLRMLAAVEPSQRTVATLNRRSRDARWLAAQ